MGAPSQVQTAGLAGISGLLKGFGGGMEDAEAARQNEMLQRAIEERQLQRDNRMAAPKNLYGPLWSKMTGLPLPEDSPDYLSANLASTLFRYPGQEDANQSRENAAKIRANAAGRGGAKEDPKTQLGKLYAAALAEGVKALGGKRTVDPNYGNVVGPDRDVFNTAAANYWGSQARGLGLTEPTPSFLTAVEGAEGKGLGGFLGFGQAATPERSALAPVPWQQQAAQQQQAPQIEARVANIIRGYKTKGMNPMQIADKLRTANINLSPEAIAQVQ